MAKSKAKAAKRAPAAGSTAGNAAAGTAALKDTAALRAPGKGRATGARNGHETPRKGRSAKADPAGGRARKRSGAVQQESALDPKLVNPPVETPARQRMRADANRRTASTAIARKLGPALD